MASRLPLHTLPAFNTVARLGNVRAAAEALHLTHSAISQQLRVLEEQLGFALFDRRGRRLVLNAAGQTLWRAAEPALAQLEAARAEAAAAGAQRQAYLRVTLTPSFAQRWLLPRMARWRDAHPELGLDLHTSQHVEDLGRGGFDAAVRQGRGDWRGAEAEPLFDSPRIAVGSPATAALLRGRDEAALAELPLLGNIAMWQQWFAQAGLKPRVQPVAAFNDAGLMLQAVEQGLGIALARGLLAADGLQAGTLVQLSPRTLASDDDADIHWLVYPPGRRDDPAIAALRDWLRTELARSARELAATGSRLSAPAGTAAAGPTGNRSRAASAPRARRRAR